MIVKFIISGKVQGVFFRTGIKDYADKIGVRGAVRNLQDNTVEVVAQGDRLQINQIMGYCKQGSEEAQVTKVDTEKLEEDDTVQKYDAFRIIY